MHEQKKISRRGFLRISSVAAIGIIFSACGFAAGTVPSSGTSNSHDLSSRFLQYKAYPEPNIDPATITNWPDYVTNTDPEVKHLYEFQLRNGNLMRYIPCFCGCGADGHRSNRDCYIKSVSPSGHVTFDPMAPT